MILEGPGVYANASLGTIISDLEFKTDQVAAMALARGVAEADIAATRFHLDSVDPDDSWADASANVHFGNYNHLDRTLTCFIETHYRVSARATDIYGSDIVKRGAAEQGIAPAEFLTDEVTAALNDYKSGLMHDTINYIANKTLAHEIDHFVEQNTLTPDEIIAKRINYRNQLQRQRQRRIGALYLGAAASLALPVIEAYAKASPELIKITGIPALITAGVCEVLAARASGRRWYSPLSHQEYKRSPWETEAEAYATQQVEQSNDNTDIDAYPLVLRCVPQPFRFV